MYANNVLPNAMIEVGSHHKPYAVTTISKDGQRTTRDSFKSPSEASRYALTQLDAGYQIEVGEMQIPSIWFETWRARGAKMSDFFLPCKNIVMGTDILNQTATSCALKEHAHACMLSIYKTGSPTEGLDYARTVLDYAKSHPLETNENPQNKVAGSTISEIAKSLPLPTFGD
ncbi:MAG: hypothetical protein V4440_04940 [Pseudomonadota bacterium]